MNTAFKCHEMKFIISPGCKRIKETFIAQANEQKTNKHRQTPLSFNISIKINRN